MFKFTKLGKICKEVCTKRDDASSPDKTPFLPET